MKAQNAFAPLVYYLGLQAGGTPMDPGLSMTKSSLGNRQVFGINGLKNTGSNLGEYAIEENKRDKPFSILLGKG